LFVYCLATMERVLMLTCQYMPDVFGGAEKQCQRVSTDLAARGHAVTVITSTQQWAQRGRRDEQGVVVRRIWTCYPPDLLGRWLPFSLWWFLAVMVWGWRQRDAFDVIHCHQGKFGAFVGVCLGRLLRRPVLIKIGNSENDLDLRCLQRKAIVGAPMLRYVLAQRPTFVAISQMIQRNLRDFGCRDIVHIPNGIPPSLRPPVVAAKAHLPDATTNVQLFYHGRIEGIKRVDVLIEAFALLRADLPGSRLHIVGDGADLARVRAAAEPLLAADAITFHGQVADAVAQVAAYDIFVNASRAEGFSNSLLEALLLGKLLVSTPVSGAAEAIVEGQNGYLAAGYDAPGLARAMLLACRRLEQVGCEQARATSHQLVEEHFTMPKIVSRYQQLYPQLTVASLA
jgi:glycosyltransferase involved in cell wall biosynthesis